MTATPLTDIQLPEQALTELRNVDADEWIHGHAIPVGRPWWTQTLAAHGLEDTLTGETIRRDSIERWLYEGKRVRRSGSGGAP